MDTLAIVLPVLLASVVGPVLLAWLTGRNEAKREARAEASRKASKEEDWARQDELAAQARIEAQLLLESNNRIAKSSLLTNGKLDEIASNTKREEP